MLDHVVQIFRIPHRNSVNGSLNDLSGQSQVVRRLEWGPQSHHFVQHAPQRPDVSLCVVVGFFYLFRTHVVRSSYVCVRILRFGRQNTAEPKIAQLYVVALVKKDIAWL